MYNIWVDRMLQITVLVMNYEEQCFYRRNMLEWLQKQHCQGAKPPLSWNEQSEPNFELNGQNEWNGTNYTILYWTVVVQEK